MQLYGKVIVIKRNGMDGNHFPITAACCLFGRDDDCDIRVQLPAVENKQCEIEIDDKGHAFIKNLSATSETIVNDKVLSNSMTALSHGDIITIVDRRFRFEFPVGSKFYPLKSPKVNSPRTPKDLHTPKTGAAENNPKMLRRSSPVSPLSPRTDNVPQSSKSSQSAKKNVNEQRPESEVNTSVPLKTGATSDDLLGLSPAAFYTAAITPRAVKNLSDSQQQKMDNVVRTSTIPEKLTATSSKSVATPIRQRSPGSPYSKTQANLRKSITDLRRRSSPVFETDEDSAHIPTTFVLEDAPATLQAGIKRKAPDFEFLSAKRKRVSFGPNLSPEHFDKSLPPKTPIKKGATPGRINRQERKSLLKMKSQRSKSASPNGLTPNKKVSPLKTPVKMSLQCNGVNIAASSSNMEIVASLRLQSPRTKPLDPSLSLRSTPEAMPEQKDFETISSSKKKSRQRSSSNTPKGIYTSPVSTHLTNNNATNAVLISPLSSPKVTSPVSVLTVSSPLTHKVHSPAIQSISQKSVTPRSSTSPQKSVTPRRSSSSPPKSVTPRRSSTSPQKSVTPRRSSSSPQESVTPRRSSTSPQKAVTSRRSSFYPHKSVISRSTSSQKSVTPRRSSTSSQKSVTPRRSSFYPQKSVTPRRSSTSPQKSVTPRRSSTSPQKSDTPRRSSSSHKKSVTPRRSSSSPQKSVTPRRLSSSPQKSVTPRRSSSSPQKSVTPRRSSSSPQKSVTPRRSSSSTQKSVTPRRSSISTQKSVTPRLSMTITSKRSSLSDQKIINSSSYPLLSQSPSASMSPLKFFRAGGMVASSENESPQVPLNEEAAGSSLTTASFTSKSDNSAVIFGLSLSPSMNAHSPSLITPMSAKTVGRKSAADKLALLEVTAVRSPNLLEEKMATTRKMKRMTPKQKNAYSVEISPIAIKRIMKTPKEKNVQISAISPTGIRNLFKTPRIRRSNHAVNTPSGLKLLLGTPKQKQILEASYVGIKEMMKTPKTFSNASFSGLSAMFNTPVHSKQGDGSLDINTNNATPSPTNLAKPIDTPRPVFSEKRNRSPKTFFDETQPTKSPLSKKWSSPKLPTIGTLISPKPQGKRYVGRPPSAKKMPMKLMNSPAGKIVSPPQDFNKVVALRAIHGHGMTPKVASLRVHTPKSGTKQTSKSTKKTPFKKTWSDIVKSGVQKSAPIKPVPVHMRAAVSKRKSPSLIKNVPRMPKTPRTIARALAPTTGHADSPATIIVGKQVLGRIQAQIPLPRKGRKQSLSKASRKSAGNTSFTGLAEMFAEPALNESGLYADIPDTPNGPNEMFVSPLSNRKQSNGSRKSTNLIGVRELFLMKEQQEPDFSGLKDLFAYSETSSTFNPSGLKRVIKTPKKFTTDVSPAGLRRIFTTPKTKSVIASPTGIDLLFKTPMSIGSSLPEVGKSDLKQAQGSSKSQKGVVGRKRKAEDSIRKPTAKKIRLSPTQMVTQITADKPASIGAQEDVQPVKISPSPQKSAGRGRPRKLQIVKSVVHVDEGALDFLDGKTVPSPTKNDRHKGQSKEQGIVDGVAPPPKTIGLGQGHNAAADGQTTASSPKKTGRGRSRKLPLISSATVEQTTKNGKTSPSLPKSTDPEEKDQVQTFESSLNKIIPSFADVENVSSPPKPTGQGRRNKVQIIEADPIEKTASLTANGKTFQPSPKRTGRGRKNKIHLVDADEVEETTTLTAVSQIVPSPPKDLGRSTRGQMIIGKAPSRSKTTGRSKRDQIAIFEAAKSPLKTTGRGSRNKVYIESTAVKETELSKHGKAVMSLSEDQVQILKSPLLKNSNALETVSVPPKTGRGKRGNLDVVAAQSTPIIPTLGRKKKVQDTETAAVEEANADVVQKPPKTTGRGKKNKVQIIKTAKVEGTVTAAEKTVPSPPKATGRGRRGQRVMEVAPSSPKPPGQGIKNEVQIHEKESTFTSGRGQVAVKAASTPPKSTGRGRKNKVLIKETVTVTEAVTPTANGKTVPEPPKATGRGRRGQAILKAASPIKITGRGKRAGAQEGKPQLEKITPVSPTKPVGMSRRGARKVTTFSSPLAAQKRVKALNPIKTESTQKGTFLGADSILEPVKSKGTRKAVLATNEEPVSSTSVADTHLRSRKRKADVTDKPTPEKKVKVDTPVKMSQSKSRTRGKASKVSPVKGPSPLKVFPEGKRSRAKKATPVKKELLIRGKRGQLEKTNISSVKGKQEDIKAAALSPAPTSVKIKKTIKEPVKSKNTIKEPVKSKKTIKEPVKSKKTIKEPVKSKKTIKEPNAISSKADTLRKSTVATRQRK